MTSDLAKARYTEALDLHVLPDLGAFFVDQIRDHDLEAWLVKPRKDRRGGKYSPHTVNGWWRVLKMVLQAATRRYYLPDPTAGVKPLPLPQREHENSLTPEELRTSWTLPSASIHSGTPSSCSASPWGCVPASCGRSGGERTWTSIPAPSRSAGHSGEATLALPRLSGFGSSPFRRRW